MHVMSSQAHDVGMSLFLEREGLVKWLITCINESTLCFGTYPLLKSWDYNSNIKTVANCHVSQQE